MKDSTKAKIDAMTIDELEHQIQLGRRSPYQREKMAYIKSRHAGLKEKESSLRHRENIEAAKASAYANKPYSPILNTGWTILGGLALACIIYLFRDQLVIPL